MTDIQEEELLKVSGDLDAVSMVHDVSQQAEWQNVVDMIRSSRITSYNVCYTKLLR